MWARLYLRPETLVEIDKVIVSPQFAADHFATHHLDMLEGHIAYIEVEESPARWGLWRVQCIADDNYGVAYYTTQSTPERFEQERRRRAHF